MRRWLPRSLWLLAWSFWAWLGLGLYRELPRTLQNPVCHLRLDANEAAWGFIADRNVVVTVSRDDNLVRSWDVLTGRSLRTWDGPQPALAISMRHGLMLTGYEIVDLLAAEGRRSFVHRGQAEFYLQKPWAVVDNGSWIDVVDLKSATRFAGGPRGVDIGEHVLACRAVDDGGQFVLLIESPAHIEEVPGVKPPQEQRLERWTLHGPIGRPIRLPHCFEAAAPEVRNGRLLLMTAIKNPDDVAVVDLFKGEIVFDANKLDETASPSGRRTSHPRLSADGRFLATAAGVVWDLTEERIVWSPRPDFETVTEADADSGALLVVEQWGALLGRWSALQVLRWNALQVLKTVAVRDFASGALRYRVRGEHPRLAHLSTNGRLCILHDRIYEMTPAIDWTLLALCQTLLALPLMLLWAALRWRRKRRMRLAGAA